MMNVGDRVLVNDAEGYARLYNGRRGVIVEDLGGQYPYCVDFGDDDFLAFTGGELVVLKTSESTVDS